MFSVLVDLLFGSTIDLCFTMLALCRQSALAIMPTKLFNTSIQYVGHTYTPPCQCYAKTIIIMVICNFSHLLITAMQSRKRERERDSDTDGTKV